MSPSSDTRPVGITFCTTRDMRVLFGISHNLRKSRCLPRGEETGKHARLYRLITLLHLESSAKGPWIPAVRAPLVAVPSRKADWRQKHCARLQGGSDPRDSGPGDPSPPSCHWPPARKKAPRKHQSRKESLAELWAMSAPQPPPPSSDGLGRVVASGSPLSGRSGEQDTLPAL